jgi:hydrogenase/urease accessory protein HupE
MTGSHRDLISTLLPRGEGSITLSLRERVRGAVENAPFFWHALLLLTLLLAPLASLAHEVRPAYLELREGQPGEFSVLWKTPMRGELRLALAPEFSGRTENLTPVATRASGDAAVQTWRIKTSEPLRGQSLRIQGLDTTMTDALARIEFADGTTWLRRLTPQAPAAMIPEKQSGWSVAGEYLKLGVEHILLGIDHLLFVLALLFITRGRWRLVKTVTAFTVAHSITLALAALGFVHVPQAPVEAFIALSIVFVAAEILRAREGHEGIAARAPWIVAFTFGLLHGFGFAGALAEIGLPEGHIPLALLFFNVGVELGQLLFIAAVLSAIATIRRIRMRFPRWTELVPPYAIGSVAMFWVIQRVAAF